MVCGTYRREDSTARKMAFGMNRMTAGPDKYINTATIAAKVGNCNAAKRDWVISGKIHE
jgi:hypothetical protein